MNLSLFLMCVGFAGLVLSAGEWLMLRLLAELNLDDSLDWTDHDDDI